MSGINVSDALFTKAQQKVLALLFGQSSKSFYLNEIVRYAAMGKGVISRELAKLAASGLLVVSKQGNQNHYQANANAAIFAELKQITLKTFGLVDLLQVGLEPILPDLEQAFVYGSVAKGEDHAGSDVDVMLVGHHLSYGNVMQLLAPIESQLLRKVNPTLYSPEEFSKRLVTGQNFLEQVMSQARINLLNRPREAK